MFAFAIFTALTAIAVAVFAGFSYARRRKAVDGAQPKVDGAQPKPAPAGSGSGSIAVALITPAPVERTCANCAHFNLEEGQAVMRQYPSFLKAAAAVTPAQIGRKVEREFERDCNLCHGTTTLNGRECYGCNGTGKVLEQELSAPGAPARASWDQMGACLKDSVVVWGGEVDKPCWTAKTPRSAA